MRYSTARERVCGGPSHPRTLTKIPFDVPFLCRYAIQLDVLVLLRRLLEHFTSSAFYINTSPEFDAVKIVVSSVIVTIGDVFLRKIATDIASEVSVIWNEGKFGEYYSSVIANPNPLWLTKCRRFGMVHLVVL